ncbi:MAG: 2-polyprenylphenol 6-hydroxylase [Alphaproteobacteria bacterium]
MANLIKVSRGPRNFFRLASVARTLARYDVLSALSTLNIPPFLLALIRLAAFPVRPLANLPAQPGERLAEAFVALGPSFTKLGQTLATRADLLGAAIAADLSRLQDSLSPFPSAEAKATVTQELGLPLEAIFRRFDDTPIAAASIAQVHFAETIEGVPVAVKILRPGIEAAFRRDLDLFMWVAETIERAYPASRRLKPREVVRTLEAVVATELDLRLEAAAAAELAENFTNDPTFIVPKVDWQRTAQRVLTIQRINGIRIDRIDNLRAAGHDPNDILRRCAEAFFKQAFRDGFFHADMHPGNMFVRSDGALAPVDFGIMGRLDRKTRYFLAEMLIGFLTGDYMRVAEVHFHAGYVPADQSLPLFAQACRAIGEPIRGRPQEEISIARLLGQLFQVTAQFRMETQPQLLLLQKTMLVAEGIGRILNPHANMWQLAQPLMEEWMRENRGPEARLVETIKGIREILDRLPRFVTAAEIAATRIAESSIKLDPTIIQASYGNGMRRLKYISWIALAIAGAALLIALS